VGRKLSRSVHAGIVAGVLGVDCSQEAGERAAGGPGIANTEHQVSFVAARLNSESHHVVSDHVYLISCEHSGDERLTDRTAVGRSLRCNVSSAGPVIHALQGSYVSRERLCQLSRYLLSDSYWVYGHQATNVEVD